MNRYRHLTKTSILSQINLRYGLVLAIIVVGAAGQAWSTRQAARVDEEISALHVPTLLTIQTMQRAFGDMDAALLRYVLGDSRARVDYLQASERLRRARVEVEEAHGVDHSRLQPFDGAIQIYEESALESLLRTYDPTYASQARARTADMWEGYSQPLADELSRLDAKATSKAITTGGLVGPWAEASATIDEIVDLHRKADRIMARHASGDSSTDGDLIGALGQLRATTGSLRTLVSDNPQLDELDPEFLVERVARYSREAESAMTASNTDNSEQAVAAVLARDDQFHSISDMITEMADVEKQHILVKTTWLNGMARQLRLGAVVAAIGVFIISAFSARWFRRQVLQPLLTMGDALARLHSGQRDLVIPDHGRQDEIGEAFANLRQLQHSLAELERVNEEQVELLETTHIESLREAYDELASKEAELRAESESLQTANLELEQFVHITSHDLREPMKKIHSLCDLAMSNLDETETNQTEAAQYLRVAITNAERLVRLVDDLRTLTAMDVSGMIPERAGVDSLIYAVLADVADEVDGGRRHISMDPLPEVECYPSLLQRAFDILIRNAIKYSANGHRISFRVMETDDPDQLRIQIVNQRRIARFRSFATETSGYGNRLLLPFARGSDADPHGSGVGLAICRRIIEIHGGRITVDDSNPIEFAVEIVIRSRIESSIERSLPSIRPHDFHRAGS